MIPVIGIPYIGSLQLLGRLIDSIPLDMVERIHVIDNSPDGFTWQGPKVVVSRMHRNLGVGAAWNLIIKLNPKARWWCILNSDIVVDRENLELLERTMRIHDIAYLNGYSAFGIRASCVQKVGWFDENYVPAYYEDNDYDYRCRLLGVHAERVGRVVDHFGSATLKASEHYQAENGRSFPDNARYYARKWGGGVGHEVFTTPFDEGGSPRDWTLDMARLSNLSWTWE